MNVQEDKPWPASPLGPAYSQQRHSPLPSPIHPSQHHSAAVQPPISSPPSAGDISHHYMSYYYSPHPHQQQSSQSYYSYYTDSRAPLRRADSSTHSTKPYYTSGFTMSSQPTTPRPSSSHSSPGNNPSSDETQPQPSSAQPQQQQEEVKPETTTIERPPALPSLTSPVHEQPTLPRGGGKMRTSRSSDNSVPRHPRQSSASYGVEESGPKFGATKYAGNVYAVDRTTVLDVRIQSKFDRGFFVADNDWTCYRRNYFQVSATFSIQGFPLYYHPAQHDAELGCLVRSDEDDQLHEVRGFLIGISARVADDDKSIPLIQHTAKRDKGPQCSPEPKPIRPGGDLNLLTRVSSSPGALLDQSVVTFERIQFKSATANNGKRRAAQQYYVLLVELYAKLASGRLVKVASNRSAQLVVRGRSPGHYSERNGKEEGSSETAGSSSAPTVLPSTNVHNNGDRGGGAAPSSIIPSADYYQAPPPPASSSYPYMNRDTNGNLPLVSPTFENGGMMRGGHDRSISAPSGPVDVYNHNGEQQHSDMNGYYKYAFYPRDHNPPPPSSSWGVHSRIASSGEPVSPYMAAPPPYYYNYYNSEHHQRSTSNNGAPLNSPGVYQGSSVPPSPYRSVSSQYEFPTNEQSPYHAQQSGGGNNFESTPQQEVKSSSAED